jgi:hypothetical protein
VARYRPIRLRKGEQRTADPSIAIEEQRPGYVRYRRVDGRRWEVHGTCDRRGGCLIGTWVEGELVEDHAHLERIKQRVGTGLLSGMDVPVTPEFDTCCGADRFGYVELEPWK